MFLSGNASSLFKLIPIDTYLAREGGDIRLITQPQGTSIAHGVRIPSAMVMLEGELNVPARAEGIVLFAHGSGSSRHSPRNQFVARAIREAGIGTLLFDLLTRNEEALDARTGHLRFDIGLLAERLIDATRWRRAIALQPICESAIWVQAPAAARRLLRRLNSIRRRARSFHAADGRTLPEMHSHA